MIVHLFSTIINEKYEKLLIKNIHYLNRNSNENDKIIIIILDCERSFSILDRITMRCKNIKIQSILWKIRNSFQ